MNIALCHFRVGETDGVSLEMEKWKIQLEKQGHRVIYIGGNPYEDTEVIEELYYKNEVNDKIVYNAYTAIFDYDETGLKEQVDQMAQNIERKLVEIIQRKNIDVIVPNNIWSLGWGLPAAVGIYNAVQKTGIRAIVHNHDFYWEREKYKNPTTDYVKELLDFYFPPKGENIKNVVINSIAREELKSRKGVEAAIVPNVFDFSSKLWEVDEYNKDFRRVIGVKEEDILILQATRITERKAIELALDTIGKLKEEENMRVLREGKLYHGRSFTGDIVFVMAGLVECEERYLNLLKKKAEKFNVRLKLVNNIIDSYRYHKDGVKIYSLWDAYVHADFITYPSILEGFGNQFLEGLFAKKPMLVYKYPVYVKDLDSIEFNIVSLGESYKLDEDGLVIVEEDIISRAAREIITYLKDRQYRELRVEENFNKGKRHFSYEALGEILKSLF
ncbi:Glycosyltransferase involved in cell wall bisynthesis [Geosporobacter subterraneus DSM 17957]|uniref:Glycosyltransferase involved in cell wall bisynthesis n=1 Tax=Geosporobacter subterraneus DSM 17957 TaxID=1121919 RepID=A0A1M6MLU6_9FIRM|nr:glycosyltransferase family 4 protein [Geosporobacter subterraneus]SHJ84448.1 Glycosyltransferase involved in cell wall bisynthesis [Geosporobacter subterraneus DSM 17957]